MVGIDSAMDTHVCELSTRTNQRSLMLGTTFHKLNLKEIWKDLCSIHKDTAACGRYMYSTAAMAAERKRQAALKTWWIVHPFSYLRFLWDVLMTVVYFVALLTIPFMVSFVVMDCSTIRFDKVNLPIYAICWLDIICNCITGYHDKKNMDVELHLSKIMKYYLRSFLIPDVISSLPYDHITFPWRKLPGSDSDFVVVLINILPLFKVTRYRTLQLNIFQMFKHFKIDNFYYEIYATLSLGIYVMFWFSCLCYLIPVLKMHFFNLTPDECKDCWTTGLQSESIALRFQHAFHIVLENISASGYGLFVPKTDEHVTLICILTIIGRLIECYIIIMFLQIIAGRKTSESKFQEIMNQVSAYTRQKQLPTHMKIRLLAYYRYRFKNSYFREKSILSNLSERLRQEVALESCRRLVENVAIFKNLPKNTLQSIVLNLKFELYLPNDVIVNAGSHGDCMFFLSAGTVAVLTPTGKEICHLDDGAHFGEVALLVPDQRRVASVVAIEVCEVYRLDRKDFRKCIAVHSELFAKIERIATERIERAVILEEQHKRLLMRASYAQEEERRRKKKEKDSSRPSLG